MTVRRIILGLGMAAFPLIVPAAVQAAEPAGAECAVPVEPAGELAPWRSPVDLVSASDPSQIKDSRLQMGQAAALALRPASAVRYPVGPGKPGGQGGLAEIAIGRAGTYRVALSSAAWVDVIAGGKAVASTRHGHGAPCSGIRKIVEFPLKPGLHVIAISASPDDTTRILVARKP